MFTTKKLLIINLKMVNPTTPIIRATREKGDKVTKIDSNLQIMVPMAQIRKLTTMSKLTKSEFTESRKL